MNLLCITFALNDFQATPQPLAHMGGARADSLLLLILGVSLVLVSLLVKGLTMVAHHDSETGGEHAGDEAPTQYPVVEWAPAPIYENTHETRQTPQPILSVDVEDYFQTEAFSAVAEREDWGRYPLRVVDNTMRLLDMFDAFDTRATFFVLGWVADRAPQLVREIAGRGHELACHSYWHRTVYSLTPEQFRQDTRDAVKAIENAAGVAVRGYRAPTWSITRKSLWAINVLADEGFEYDSSVYPVRHDLYGIPGAMAHPYVWKTDSGSLIEMPPATFSIGKTKLPAAGGGYLRIFPLRYATMAIDQSLRHDRLPVVYLHPWEIDPDQPRLNGAWKSRLRQYWGLSSFESKLEGLLASYRFVPFRHAGIGLADRTPRVLFNMATMVVTS